MSENKLKPEVKTAITEAAVLNLMLLAYRLSLKFFDEQSPKARKNYTDLRKELSKQPSEGARADLEWLIKHTEAELQKATH